MEEFLDLAGMFWSGILLSRRVSASKDQIDYATLKFKRY
jgi:hypothetical protein